ncbi:MAG: cyclodeaminase/cyclohydrolase family protein [Tissierellia bacterium]|nr:cyclodeaminase/cyclohydrolase family protein [Tissierellia bacterium]
MITDRSLEEYVTKVASGDPTPGGGSVAALAGSLGTALTSMVGNLTIGKKAYEELSADVKENMDDDFAELQKSIERLNRIVHEDTTAFDGVMQAFKLPRETEEEKAKRSAAIQEGYKVALEVPLRAAEECYRVLELQRVFADHGNVNAITDVGVGALLIATGLEGSLFNVRINLLSIKDEEYRNRIESRMNQLLEDGNQLRDSILETVYERLG